MEFPDTFNSYHRSIVHRVSEEYGFVHESSGVGKERKIVISKKDEETKDFEKKLTKGPEDNQELEMN